MATEIPIDETPTNGANPYIDALVSKGAWIDDDGGTVTIKVSFAAGTTDRFGVFGEDWTDPELAAGRAALLAWSTVANIEFVEVPQDEADIKLWRISADDMAELDGGFGGLGISDVVWDPSDKVNVYFNSDDASWSATDSLQPGGYAYATLIHEIGHAIGLAHPHGNGNDPGLPQGTAFPGVATFADRGDFDLNQGVFTVMTYNDGWQVKYPNYTAVDGNFGFGWQATPMALDIAAVQAIYGPNSNVATTDDIYALPTVNEKGTGWRSIWDTGGIDTISAVGAKASAYIALNAASLIGATAGGTVAYVDGIIGGSTIAPGVVIENAVGGDFADTLIGNHVENFLIGGLGDDVLYGGDKGDQLAGGEGIDTATYVLDGAVTVALDASAEATGAAIGDLFIGVENLIGSATGDDTLIGDGNTNVITGSGGNDNLHGRDGDDTLLGSSGDDTLVGGAGANKLDGGENSDFASYYFDGAVEIALDGSFANAGEALDDTLTSIENLSGSNTGNDKLAGTAEGNSLFGNGGDDEIFGMGGADLLKGGRGKDTVSGGFGSDIVRGDGGVDILLGKSGNDVLVGGTGKDSLNGGMGADQYRYEARQDLGDTISSFGSTDTFAFKKSEFKNLKKGFLGSEHLIRRNDNQAVEKDDYFIFEKDTDKLWFDPDGSGSKKPVLVADMGTSVDITVKDILII